MSGGHTRAQFLGSGAAAVGGAALASAWGAAERADGQVTAEAAAKPKPKPKPEVVTEGAFGPSFTGDAFFFELDGEPAGNFVQSPQGGVAYADVVAEKIGPDSIAKKHVANIKWNEMSVQCGVAMSKGFYNWMKDSFDHKFTRRSGSIIAADFDFRVKSQGTFQNALLTEVGFPALDGAAKDPAYMTIKWAPESTSSKKSSGQISGKGFNPKEVSFKLEIDGLSSARISKIDAFTWKQAVVSDSVGTPDTIEVEVPNLAVWLSQGSGLNTWTGWFEDFVINGNNGDDKERNGTLSFYQGSKNIASLELQHLGVFKMTPEKVEAGSESIRRVKYEMYCENMAFDFPGSV